MKYYDHHDILDIFQLHIKAFTMAEEIFTISLSRKFKTNLFQLNLIIPFFTMVEEIFTINQSKKLQINLFKLNLIIPIFTVVEEIFVL